MENAEWKYIGFESNFPNLSINQTFDTKKIKLSKLPKLRLSYLKHAEKIVKELEKNYDINYRKDDKEIEELKYFYYCQNPL